jgi:putative peptidoglycan lipid II flippase
MQDKNGKHKKLSPPVRGEPVEPYEQLKRVNMSSQNRILKKTIEVGGSTLLSKLFGILRELLMVRYLGATGLSDVFIIAFRIPNSLRKIFAEGALSAAFTPTAINIIKHEGKEAVAGLVSLSFLIFEGAVLLLCVFIMYYADPIIRFLVPGFSEQQITKAIPMLHILMPYIFFISSSALLGGAFHAVGHFFIPAIAPFIMNIIFIAGILACLLFNLPVTTLCWFILLSGAVHFAMHVIIYFKLQFSFGTITRKNLSIFARIMGKFLLCLPSISLMELALYVDTNLGSYLAEGSISLFYYANRFVGIPLGVFAVAFSTILLPHFSHVNTYSPKRLHFYLLESTKFILWGTIPIALLMAFFSEEIFSTLFLSEKFSALQAHEAGNILLAFLLGLFFFSMNKILLNIFYAMHAAWIPAIVALGTTTLNIILNRLLIGQFQTVGLALATSIASIVQTIAFLIILRKHHNFRIYLMPFLLFAMRYAGQLALFSGMFWACYHSMIKIITLLLPPTLSLFFIAKIGLWLWVGPLALIFLILLYFSRPLFKINLHFLK